MYRDDQNEAVMTDTPKSISGCTKFDDIQSRLQQAKKSFVSAVTDEEKQAARAALAVIEQEAAAHASKLNDDMRADYMRRLMSRLF
jgi:hypothetical protein